MVHERRLRKALRLANEQAGTLDSWGEVEAELSAMLDAFIERWLGPAKNRTRDG